MLQVALCDSWLDWGGRLVPLQSSACARSSVLDMALRQAAKRGPGGGPVLTLDSSQLDSLRACVGRLTPLALERFLAALAGAALEKHCSEVEQVVQLLKLADWFDAHELRDRCDERLVQLLTGISNRQQINDSREEAAAMALEAGVQHYLTKTVGWLLPWALQQLSRGDKHCPGAAAAEQLSGELHSQQHSAWFQDRAARRRRRLHAALMADDHIKVLLMEQQWWAQHDDFEQCCPSCSAAPSDLRPAYDCTGEAWVWSRDGSSYRAAAAHFAHLLVERCWGLTPAGSGFGTAAPHAEAGAPGGGLWGAAALVRMGSMSSVGHFANSLAAPAQA
ncbi:hypothetical protein ABPG77_005574 [Micractinium sp. CCAP 211/92]